MVIGSLRYIGVQGDANTIDVMLSVVTLSEKKSFSQQGHQDVTQSLSHFIFQLHFSRVYYHRNLFVSK